MFLTKQLSLTTTFMKYVDAVDCARTVHISSGSTVNDVAIAFNGVDGAWLPNESFFSFALPAGYELWLKGNASLTADVIVTL